MKEKTTCLNDSELEQVTGGRTYEEWLMYLLSPDWLLSAGDQVFVKETVRELFADETLTEAERQSLYERIMEESRQLPGQHHNRYPNTEPGGGRKEL